MIKEHITPYPNFILAPELIGRQGYYDFSKLRERYKAWTGNSMEEKLFDSFEMRDGHSKLTNAVALLADDAPIKHSRLFCTCWKKTANSRI